MSCTKVQTLPIDLGPLWLHSFSSLLPLVQTLLVSTTEPPIFWATSRAEAIIALLPYQQLLVYLPFELEVLSSFYSLVSLPLSYSSSNVYLNLLPSHIIVWYSQEAFLSPWAFLWSFYSFLFKLFNQQPSFIPTSSNCSLVQTLPSSYFLIQSSLTSPPLLFHHLFHWILSLNLLKILPLLYILVLLPLNPPTYFPFRYLLILPVYITTPTEPVPLLLSTLFSFL